MLELIFVTTGLAKKSTRFANNIKVVRFVKRASFFTNFGAKTADSSDGNTLKRSFWHDVRSQLGIENVDIRRTKS